MKLNKCFIDCAPPQKHFGRKFQQTPEEFSERLFNADRNLTQLQQNL